MSCNGSSPKAIKSSLRDKSPRLSAEMRRHSRVGENGSPSTSPHQRVSFEKGCPPALSSGRAGMSDGSMQKTFQEAMRHRRTSLPANNLNLLKPLQGTNNVSEARGIIVDMLQNKELPTNVVSCLRAVATLLNPHTPMSMHSLNVNDFGLPSVVENPYSGEQLIVSNSSKPRVSNITFSTVTSATGLPTIAAEPNRPRSSSYWKPESTPVSESACSLQQGSPGTSTGSASDSPLSSSKQLANRKESGTLCDTVVTTIDGQRFDTRELDHDRDLQQVSEWSLPIFDMAERHRVTVLSRLTYTVFKQADLFRIFKVSPIKFFNFFHALEKGYWDIPYHNRLHAADVLHGCYYLTCHPVRPLFGPPTSPDSLLPMPHTPAVPIASSMSTLELMALYTAAAMHDFDHPGRTNAFLVAAEDKKAILYNDRSVLENHHAAASWRLLCQPENNFIESLDVAETKRFRYLVLEYILATDLKHHFDIILAFNEKLQTNEMELSNESDRLLAAKMVIKMADINSPTKPYSLHRQWTDRICEEFFEQGDEERRRGLAVTTFMDRATPRVAQLQDSFISHVVSPLAVAMNEAGILPVLPGLVEPEMMINLKHNHQKWLSEIARTSTPPLTNGVIEEESSAASDSPNRKNSPSLDSEVE